jgi:hypothetical protein
MVVAEVGGATNIDDSSEFAAFSAAVKASVGNVAAIR